MEDRHEQRNDRDRSLKDLSELLLLYALQAADYGLIAQFWIGSQEEALSIGATHFYSH